MRKRCESRYGRYALYLLIPLIFAACATLPPATTHARHTDFTARLIVIDTHSRWQAMLDWHAVKANEGRMRITHAATSRVVELRWQGKRIWLRDNQAASPVWRRVAPGELAEHGIPVQPTELAALLLGENPPGFRKTGSETWQARRGKARILATWRGNRLTITDTTHGRRATLIILRERGAPHA